MKSCANNLRLNWYGNSLSIIERVISIYIKSIHPYLICISSTATVLLQSKPRSKKSRNIIHISPYCTKIVIWTCLQNASIFVQVSNVLTHWGRVMHICVCKLIIIGCDNGLLLGRCQAIIWANAGILLVTPSGINFIEISSEIQHFHSIKCIWKCCLQNDGHFVSGLNVLTIQVSVLYT